MRDFIAHIFQFFIDLFKTMPESFFTSKTFWLVFCFFALAVGGFFYFTS